MKKFPMVKEVLNDSGQFRTKTDNVCQQKSDLLQCFFESEFAFSNA